MGEESQTKSAASVLGKLERSLPVDDLVGWLLEEYPGIEREGLVSMLREIYGAGFDIAPASTEQRTYRVGDREFRAHPQRVRGAPA